MATSDDLPQSELNAARSEFLSAEMPALIAYARTFMPRASEMDVENVVQEAVLKTLSYSLALSTSFWQDKARALSFTQKIIRLQAWELARKTRRYSSEFEPVWEEFASRPELPLVDVREAIKSLPETDALLIESLLNGFSTRDAAAKLNLSEAAVRVALYRAKEQLRSALEGNISATVQLQHTSTAEPPFPDPDPEMDAIELYLDPGNASPDELRDVLRALNDLHIASGGLGFEFRIDGTFVSARKEVLV